MVAATPPLGARSGLGRTCQCFPSSKIRYSISRAPRKFRLVAPSAGCVRYSPSALIILPLPVHVAATKFGWREPSLLKFRNYFLGSRLVGLPIRKKFLIPDFLTGALLLATTPFWAGAADRHQNRIGQIGGNWPIPVLD